jgi:hypothetical protein
MNLKDISGPRAGREAAESVAVQIDRALASLDEAETNLRNLRSSHLAEMASALATAASDLDALRLSLSASDTPPRQGKRVSAALRDRMKKLGCASSRVCALYGAARAFHAGLALIRRSEEGAYDARGEICRTTAGCLLPHGLETKG